MSSEVVMYTDFKELGDVRRGKVRDIYDLGDSLLIISTDRISAFDVVLKDGIPGKGFVLNQLSRFWFEHTAGIIDNHLISTDISQYPAVCRPWLSQLDGRSMLVRKAVPLPVECIVRGYISGSAWKEYSKAGSISGMPLPPGLMESSRFEFPIFTPSTKAEIGMHDENISFQKMQEMVGENIASRVKDASVSIYNMASDMARARGIIIADTKLEFGIFEGGLILIDEVLTPDSSRFWPMEQYQPGKGQDSFDKQFVRDYLLSINWETLPEIPRLPSDIISRTSDLYFKAYNQLIK